MTNEVYQERLEDIDKVGTSQQIKILAIDSKTLQEQLLLQLITTPKITTTSNNLAYVIYTSGTTGNPKGVMIEHRGIINTLLSQCIYLDIKNSAEPILSFGLFSNYVFDASVSGIFLPLISGHKLIIAELVQTINIFDFLTKNKVNIAIISAKMLTN